MDIKTAGTLKKNLILIFWVQKKWLERNTKCSSVKDINIYSKNAASLMVGYSRLTSVAALMLAALVGTIYILFVICLWVSICPTHERHSQEKSWVIFFSFFFFFIIPFHHARHNGCNHVRAGAKWVTMQSRKCYCVFAPTALLCNATQPWVSVRRCALFTLCVWLHHLSPTLLMLHRSAWARKWRQAAPMDGFSPLQALTHCKDMGKWDCDL